MNDEVVVVVAVAWWRRRLVDGGAVVNCTLLKCGGIDVVMIHGPRSTLVSLLTSAIISMFLGVIPSAVQRYTVMT